MARFDERRRIDREQLRARLRDGAAPAVKPDPDPDSVQRTNDHFVTVGPRAAFGAEFEGADGFLNSPTYGLPPTFLLAELSRCIADWSAGSLDATGFDEPVHRGRVAYAALTGVPVESVAMGGSVSAVLGLVAAAVPDGARVATLAGEFTSTTFPFAAQAARGVSVTELSAQQLVATAADYDVVVASLVQSANGAVLDVDALRAGLADAATWVGPRRHASGRVEATRSRLGRRDRRRRCTSGFSHREGRRGCR